ncbi:MAG: MTAP family purine nucleoside phosphorylase [Candidatus Heimdallarchaeota archaeon]|nr:MTAP family purine nucleoside phosphorylase [Candidatus Heimdallarchaeota archaeon]
MKAIIGGSGFYEFIPDATKKTISTPFGEVTVDYGMVENHEVIFIPRHGSGHSITPSNINYRANIFAAFMMKADMIFATNAVGSLHTENPPGSLAVLDQVIDFTSGRYGTFFDGSDLEVTTYNGKILNGVVHTDVTNTFDTDARAVLIEATKSFDPDVREHGTIVVVNGPRFETPAEINAYRILGADYAGMTTAPEVFLAKELHIPYATLAVCTNFAAGMQSGVSHEEVGELFGKKIKLVQNIFQKVLSM